jgi:hypothetical protein
MILCEPTADGDQFRLRLFARHPVGEPAKHFEASGIALLTLELRDHRKGLP